MARERLSSLAETLQKDLERAEKVTNQNLQSAKEISIATAASPSMSGDREHAVNQAAISVESLKKLKDVVEEIRHSLLLPPPEVVKPACFVILKFEGEEENETFCILTNSLFLQEYKVVTSQSPLGKALMSKKTGDCFEFKLPGARSTIQGRIVAIE